MGTGEYVWGEEWKGRGGGFAYVYIEMYHTTHSICLLSSFTGMLFRDLVIGKAMNVLILLHLVFYKLLFL